MENPRPEGEKIIKDIRNLKRTKLLKKELNYIVVKEIRDLFR